MERIQKKYIIKDLNKKMVIIVGPRQTGKTYLAKEIAKLYTHSVYLNYDQPADKEIMEAQAWLTDTNLLIFDELHKMPHWKNYLKGIYDTKAPHLKIIVTGSARMDTFTQVGDSLAGRYFLHRLLPLSLAELKQLKIENIHLNQFIETSGFPEPFLDTDMLEVKRWRLQYTNSLLSTDIFEIDEIQNVKAFRLVFELLRRKVGSPISYQSIAEDVGISPNTAKKYISILEALYVIFRVTPYSNNIARSLLKEPKIYFFDTGLVPEDSGAKLENLVALSLLKHIYAKIDYQAENYKLHYLRTKDGIEVDFALVKDEKIVDIIEVKYRNHDLNPSLVYFHQKYELPAIQVVQELKQEKMADKIRVLKASHYLSTLDL